MTAHPIQIANLELRHGRKVALDAVNLEIEHGCVYALLGRNGAGKSSLIQVLIGLRKANTGKASIFGLDSFAQRHRSMARIGVVHETPSAPAWMSSAQLEAHVGSFHETWMRVEVIERIEAFGIDLETRFGELSRGQRAQVCLALALGHRPDLLILDDPTLGLDIVARGEFFGSLIDELAERGTTVLLASHDLAGVARIADRVGILIDGKMVVDEALEGLKTRCRRLTLPGAGADQLVALLGHLSPLRIEEGSMASSAVITDFDPDAELPPDLTVESLGIEEIFTAYTAA